MGRGKLRLANMIRRGQRVGEPSLSTRRVTGKRGNRASRYTYDVLLWRPQTKGEKHLLDAFRPKKKEASRETADQARKVQKRESASFTIEKEGPESRNKRLPGKGKKNGGNEASLRTD